MNSRLCLAMVALFAQPLYAFVHISQVKPHLPVSPDHPAIVFQWNGEAPSLKDKNDVLNGAFANASDSELMEELLKAAMGKWNEVESAYLEFQLEVNPGVVKDDEDEIFAIVVESQDSESVAAAALPKFKSEHPDESPNKKSGRIIFDCDISVSNKKVSAKYLLKTLTHELGHCVGLGHPHSNYHSIMSYSNISDSSQLGIDDKAGITFLYPEPGISQDVKYLTTCGSVGGGSREAGLALLLIPLGLGVASALKRPRKGRART